MGTRIHLRDGGRGGRRGGHLKTIKRYIENQKDEDDGEGFEVTAPTKP